MPYGRKKSGKRVSKKSVAFSKKSTAKPNRDYRFKAINDYKVKPEPFPRVLYTRAKYTGFEALVTSNANISDGYSYRLNTIWDPFFGVNGSTVAGWSTLAAIYNRYLVTGAKVNISFNDPSNDGMRVGYRLRQQNNATAIGGDMTSIISQPMTYIHGISNSGSQRKTFSFFVRPWTLAGVSKLEYMANTTKYSAPMASFPAQSDTGFLDVFALSETTAIASVKFCIKIIFYVQLYERGNLLTTTITGQA